MFIVGFILLVLLFLFAIALNHILTETFLDTKSECPYCHNISVVTTVIDTGNPGDHPLISNFTIIRRCTICDKSITN